MTIDDFLALIQEGIPPVSQERLASFEQDLGQSLPEDYRHFLEVCNGGYLPKAPWFKGANPEGEEISVGASHVLGFREEWHFSLQDQLRDFGGRIPDAFLCVMGDPFGNLICIGLRGPFRSRVFFWNHENEADESWSESSGEPPLGLQLVANSFTDFVAGLRPLEEN